MDSYSFCGHLITLSNNPSICHAVADPHYSPRICPLLTTAGGLLTTPPPPWPWWDFPDKDNGCRGEWVIEPAATKIKYVNWSPLKGQGCKHNQIQNAIDNNKEIGAKALKSIRGSSPLYCYAKCRLVKQSVFTIILSCIDEQKLGIMKMFKKHM